MAGKQTPEHARRIKPDSSHPADNDAGGRPEPAQPSTDEQSGSTGRRVADDRQPAGPDTGQDNYGQNGADNHSGKRPHRR